MFPKAWLYPIFIFVFAFVSESLSMVFLYFQDHSAFSWLLPHGMRGA